MPVFLRAHDALRPRFASAVVLLPVLLIAGCGKKNQSNTAEYNIGDRVQVGHLTYNVLETQWKSQLGTFPAARMPQNDYLLVRVSVTNGGGEEVSVPMLTIQNSAGASFQEMSDGTGVDDWLGVIRRVGAGETDLGWIVFDVPMNGYKLRVTNATAAETDPGDEKAAFVKLPLQMQGRLIVPTWPR